ncbi:MAG: hypothetical protein C4529_03405 [Deltaproteobacteria bacterium]|nr:MAG: hypothetical protein C4529_03405 [Deltaproteobacteria bacterium]
MSALQALSARFASLSSREKSLLSACLLCVALFVAVKWIVLPAKAGHARNAAAIPQRQATIARYEAMRQGQEPADEELFLQVQQLEKWEEGLLAGETASAAGVFLQGVLKPLTNRPDVRVTSIRSLPPVRKGAYAEIAVQMEMQTTTEGLALLLADVSRQPKILRVRKLSASTGSYYPGQAQRKETVVVSMVVAGLSHAAVDDKGQGGGEE